MISRKLAAAVVLILLAVLASQPAMAGVGGCKPGVGGCGWGQISTNAPTSNIPVVLDSLRGAVRADFLQWIKTVLDGGRKDSGHVQQGGTQTDDGVGGCRFGVGGCVCFNGIC